MSEDDERMERDRVAEANRSYDQLMERCRRAERELGRLAVRFTAAERRILQYENNEPMDLVDGCTVPRGESRWKTRGD